MNDVDVAQHAFFFSKAVCLEKIHNASHLCVQEYQPILSGVISLPISWGSNNAKMYGNLMDFLYTRALCLCWEFIQWPLSLTVQTKYSSSFRDVLSVTLTTIANAL